MKIKIKNDDKTMNNTSQDTIPEDFDSSYIMTIRGPVAIRYYSPEKPKAAVLFANGVSTDWESPAQDLYPRLGKKLKQANILSLQVKYRLPKDIGEVVYDIVAGLRFIESQGIEKIGLVGHSLGGAAVIQAATVSKKIRTIVTLSAQSLGADSVSKLPAYCSILLIHGDNDMIMPAACSQTIYELAHDPKEILILEDDHMLNKSAKKVYQTVHSWLTNAL
jgi:dienelactone hydrolase